jgi:hypothetical protein
MELMGLITFVEVANVLLVVRLEEYGEGFLEELVFGNLNFFLSHEKLT